MAGFMVGCVLALIFIPLALRYPGKESRALGTLGAPVVPPAPEPARRPTSMWTWLPPIVFIVAGLVVALWPQAASDCHGSPVCALDAFGKLAQLFIGGVLGLVGLAWLGFAGCISAFRR
jgi:hypothetical protein